MTFKLWSIVGIISAIILVFMPKYGRKEALYLNSIPIAEQPLMSSIESYGYPVERHEIVTKDGYILVLHRIPRVENGSQCDAKVRSVLLIPGLAGSSENWFVLGPTRSLPYLLSDQNYDVWLCNVRGTTHSRRHITLEAENDIKFWNFSYHEMGLYDIPATVDYILNTTHQERLYFIGYSQGVMGFQIMTSELPEYNKKIALMIALAPTPYTPFVNNFMTNLAIRFAEMLLKTLRFFNVKEMFPHLKFLAKCGKKFCGENMFNTKKACKSILLFDDNFDIDERNHRVTEKILPTLLDSFPGGTSLKMLFHYVQGCKSQKFAKFDYGPEENLKMYGSVEPPEYNMSKVRAPTIVYYSVSDYMVSYHDIQLLIKKLPNVIKTVFIKKGFNHSYFLWSSKSREVYDSILKTLAHVSS